MKFDSVELEKALFLLNGRLTLNNARCFSLIVCGGSALLFNNLIQRVTKDVYTDDDLIQAAQWSMTHDPSEGYRQSMEILLKEIGYEHIIERI